MANRFLVSTTHHLLAIEPESHMLWRIHSGAGLYFGLAKGPDGVIYAACRNTAFGPEDETVRASERGSVLVLDANFRMCDELRPAFPLRDLHGIAYFDRRLWITCSYDNMVAIYDLATGDWNRWYPVADSVDRDVHHFNTIRFLEGQVCLVAHHFGPSEVFFFDYPSLRLAATVPLGRMSHDLFLYENAIATCSSGDGWIVNRNGRRLRTGGFPRGVATTPSGNLVGMSMQSPRGQRQYQSGILRWYDPDWRFKTDFTLKDIGMVLDVLAIQDQGSQWNSFEPWQLAEATSGAYNRVAPGNIYRPEFFSSGSKSEGLEWHGVEETHRWTAALDATISVLINPGETRLSVELSSANPNPYSVEVWLNERCVATIVFRLIPAALPCYRFAFHIFGCRPISFVEVTTNGFSAWRCAGLRLARVSDGPGTTADLAHVHAV